MNVPFTWQGSGGNSQMTAGGENDPIYFTNLIFGNSLYTITYKAASAGQKLTISLLKTSNVVGTDGSVDLIGAALKVGT